jgi:hypothetical protein
VTSWGVGAHKHSDRLAGYASKEYGCTDVVEYVFGVGEHRTGDFLENQGHLPRGAFGEPSARAEICVHSRSKHEQMAMPRE